MHKLLIFVVLFCSGMHSAIAQDPHFSQFFASPLTLSPAFTGKIDGTYRVAGNYRNQWPAFNRAFNTTTLSVDFPIMRNHIGVNDIWGLGFMGFSDQSANSTVKFNYLTVSTAYHKGLDEDGYHQIGAGFQATYANMLVNVANLKFEDQLTPFGFTGTTTELFDNSTLQTKYWDLNAGLLYTGSTSDQNHFYAGVSMYHINRPRQQFTGALYLLNPRTTFHSGGYFPVGQSSTIHLSGLYSMQAGASEAVIGGAWQYVVDESGEKPTSLYLGSWYRLNDAIIPYVGLEFNDFRLGATYDVNTSSLKPASQARGGMEISLIYTRRPPEQRSMPCPKF
ncbi:PorP/SprF family type IX secretion system membrane protein [Aridibaculum aurantiacum]|uniref:PorP/SprF family type IX secretion system membrane protein n=1 Tax=Aridibaculum aurantiacum TaxID=2810307 RepID=UPI001A95F19B|nr:PorP/SprF family type IX secretion system membrane protein [Aridibaculum aurantiacum]